MQVKPILFSGPMIRGILEGRKTQTRRVVKPKDLIVRDHNGKRLAEIDCELLTEQQGVAHSQCPSGKPGDLLWVRETTEAYEYESGVYSRYVADGVPVLYSACDDPMYNGSLAHWNYFRDSRPSIHMPGWASRLTLEITNVRVERLQDISEADAIAEGAMVEDYECQLGEGYTSALCYHHGQPENEEGAWFDTAKESFRDLWQSINGGDSWAQNPWVWMVEFKVHRCNVDAYLRKGAA